MNSLRFGPASRSLAIAAVLTAAGSVGAAVAQMDPAIPPVTINSCGPVLGGSSNSPSFMGIPIASNSSGMQIEFVNESKQVAKLVNFAVDSNGTHFVIRDVGTFSPGVTIRHQYRNGSGQGFLLPSFIAPKVTCHVSSVEFTDGSVWRKGHPPAVASAPNSPASRGLTVTPKHVNLDSHTESALFFVQDTGRVAGLKETDNCAGIASVYLGATGDSSVTYTVKPIAPGSCAAHVIDETGATVSIPIAVR